MVYYYLSLFMLLLLLCGMVRHTSMRSPLAW
jgi:hypothetical protein